MSISGATGLLSACWCDGLLAEAANTRHGTCGTYGIQRGCLHLCRRTSVQPRGTLMALAWGLTPLPGHKPSTPASTASQGQASQNTCPKCASATLLLCCGVKGSLRFLAHGPRSKNNIQKALTKHVMPADRWAILSFAPSPATHDQIHKQQRSGRCSQATGKKGASLHQQQLTCSCLPACACRPARPVGSGHSALFSAPHNVLLNVIPCTRKKRHRASERFSCRQTFRSAAPMLHLCSAMPFPGASWKRRLTRCSSSSMWSLQGCHDAYAACKNWFRRVHRV